MKLDYDLVYIYNFSLQIRLGKLNVNYYMFQGRCQGRLISNETK